MTFKIRVDISFILSSVKVFSSIVKVNIYFNYFIQPQFIIIL